MGSAIPIKPSEPGKVSTDRRENRDLYGHGAGGHGPHMAGKNRRCPNALKAAFVKAGRMKWFLGFEQSKDINVNLRIFADEACSQPLEFIEVNQYGESYGQPGKVVTQRRTNAYGGRGRCQGHFLCEDRAS